MQESGCRGDPGQACRENLLGAGDFALLRGMSTTVIYSATEAAEDIVTLVDQEKGPPTLARLTCGAKLKGEPGARSRAVDGEEEGRSRYGSGPPPYAIMLQDFAQGVSRMCFGTDKAILLDLGGIDISNGA